MKNLPTKEQLELELLRELRIAVQNRELAPRKTKDLDYPVARVLRKLRELDS